MTNSDFAASLRLLADFYEQHPDFPFPWGTETVNTFVHNREQLAEAARQLGRVEKDCDESFFVLKRKFGEITLCVNSYHAEVCERVKVGERHIPEHAIPDKPEEVVPARTEDIYEWRCPESILDTH